MFDVVNCRRDATYISVVGQDACSGRGFVGAIFESAMKSSYVNPGYLREELGFSSSDPVKLTC